MTSPLWYCHARAGEREVTEKLLKENPWVTATRSLERAYREAGPGGLVYIVKENDPAEEGDLEEGPGYGWYDFPAHFVGWHEKTALGTGSMKIQQDGHEDGQGKE